MRELLNKVKTTWNNLSFTRRRELKASAAGAGLVAAGAAVTVLAIATLPLLAGAGFVAAVWGLSRVVIGVRGLADEIRNGQKTEAWKNTAGQIIESTLSQKRDLLAYAKIINPPNRVSGGYPAVARHSTRMARFNAVANDPSIVVVKDIPGGNHAFRFQAVPTLSN